MHRHMFFNSTIAWVYCNVIVCVRIIYVYQCMLTKCHSKAINVSE